MLCLTGNKISSVCVARKYTGKQDVKWVCYKEIHCIGTEPDCKDA